MNEKELAYLAGLIDGEGTIGLTRIKSNENRSPVITVVSTSRELVEWCKNKTLKGSITNKRTYEDHHKPSFAWAVKYTMALELMAQVLPFMVEKKKIRRVEYILNIWVHSVKRNGRYTPQMLEDKKSIEEKFFSL